MSNLDRTPVLVRVDSTKAIGCGHVMRCIALAQGLRRAGHLVHFVGRIDSESLKARLDCEGIPFTSIESMHPSPDDLEKTIHILQSEKKPKGGWVVLDGYHFNFEYQSALRSLGYRVLLLDDNAHQPKYNVDILLNQNVTAGSFEYRTNDDAMRLFGPQYVLLREEFLGLKSARREIGKIKSLLVSIGGRIQRMSQGWLLRLCSNWSQESGKSYLFWAHRICTRRDLRNVSLNSLIKIKCCHLLVIWGP